MNRSFDSLRAVGIAVQERQRALDLRGPDESDRACRAGEAILADQFIERPCDFEDRDAAAGVVVRAGTGMIEVAAIDDFFAGQLWIAAGDGCRRKIVETRRLSSTNDSI